MLKKILNIIWFDLLDDNVVFIKRYFKETLYKYPFSKFSIIRLDGDKYQSTIESLNALYNKFLIGGYCILIIIIGKSVVVKRKLMILFYY